MPDLPIQMSTAVADTPGSPGTPEAGAPADDAFAALLEGQLKPGAVPGVAVAPEIEPAGDAASDATGGTILPPELAGLLVALAAAPAAPAAPTPATAAVPAPADPQPSPPRATARPDPLAALGIALDDRAGTGANGRIGAGGPDAPAQAATIAETPAASAGSGAAQPSGTAAIAQDSGTIAVLPAAAAAHASHAGAAAQPTASIAAQVGSMQWESEIAHSVLWMVGRNAGRAQFVLDPPELGRIEVSLTVSHDAASAVFVSSSSEVRDALQQALPRLREALAQAGIALGQADVNAESAGDQAGRGSARHASFAAIGSGTPASGAPSWARRAHGLVDTFA